MIPALFLTLTFLFSLAPSTAAQDAGSFSGYVFGDYYWAAASHQSGLENRNGFRIRRIYLTYERALYDNISTRLRLEMDQPGDFTTESKMTPVVKDAYLRWDTGGPTVYLGIASTPTWGLVEDVWGYRSIERSPLDLHDLGSSRDFGVEVTGSLLEDDRLHYDLMFANGSSNRAEINRGKKLMGSLGYDLTETLTFEVYGDWNDNPGAGDAYTGQLFLGYQGERLRLGALAARQVQEQLGSDLERRVASLFGSAAVTEHVSVLGRVDRMFDPNPAGPSIDYLPFAPANASTLLIGGIDVEPRENIHLMPNVEVIVYDESPAGERPATDVMPRMTFYYRF